MTTIKQPWHDDGPSELEDGLIAESAASRSDARDVASFSVPQSADFEFGGIEYQLIDDEEREADARHQRELDRLVAEARSAGESEARIRQIIADNHARRACIGEVPEDFVDQESSANYQTPKAVTGFTRVATGRRSQLVACACPGCANKVRRTSNRQQFCCDACRQRTRRSPTV